ncbi:MAG TPA: ATP-grasp domain-containing protein [Acidobacteriota bacterium]|nr:ATP-grasp domain-containing protein [Acidobacteriota bacterium]HNH83477.1 ATP-grasp domain-containing protein [Acidobacteriota bacterium]
MTHPFITRVFIEEAGQGRMDPEMADLAAEFAARGIPVDLFTEKKLLRRWLPLSRTTLVAGSIPVVVQALKQLKVEIPRPNDYPHSLQPWFKRRIWPGTVGNVLQSAARSWDRPLFIKPRENLKRFTGKVFESESDVWELSRFSKHTPVWCAEVVRWLVEYRVFVVKSSVIGIRWYAGDAHYLLDETVMTKAIQVFEASGEAHAAYAIDFGVLETGETALIEVNDGFSIGAYGLDRGLYAEFTLTRWLELMEGQDPGALTF